MSKRYVLLEASREMGEAELKKLGEVVQGFPGSKLITLERNRTMVIAKTTNLVAPILREKGVMVGDLALKTVLTSGNIGKLKRRARGEGTNGVGQVPQ